MSKVLQGGVWVDIGGGGGGSEFLATNAVYSKSSYPALATAIGTNAAGYITNDTVTLPQSGAWVGAMNKVGVGFIIDTQSSTAYYTQDGGVTWRATAAAIPTVNMVAAPGCCAINASGQGIVGMNNVSSATCLYTTDGGSSWATATLPSAAVWGNCACINDSGDAFMFGSAGGNFSCAYSTNGGATWTASAALPDPTDYFIAAGLSNSGKGFAPVTGDTKVLVTTNAGATWTVATGAMTSAVSSYATMMNNNGVCLVADYRPSTGGIQRSTDYGNTWSAVTFTGSVAMSYAGALNDAGVGILLGGGDYTPAVSTKASFTVDAGVTWNVFDMPALPAQTTNQMFLSTAMISNTNKVVSIGTGLNFALVNQITPTPAFDASSSFYLPPIGAFNFPLSDYVKMDGTAQLSGDLQSRLKQLAMEPLVSSNGGVLRGGYSVQTGINPAQGTSGSIDLDPNAGNMQTAINNGSLFISAPTRAGSYTIVLEVTNATGITQATGFSSGFDKVTGDVFTMTVGAVFQVFVTKTPNACTAAVVQCK